MRRRITVAIAGGAFIALLVAVPRWTAAQAEARRESDFEMAVKRSVPANLPPCPLPGPERDKFLGQSAATLTGSRNLWIPVCRVVPLPAHQILVMTTKRAELSYCKVDSSSVNACILEEPLDFLADTRAPRTWARRENGAAIWLTSRPMAWQDHLIAEHRERMALGLLLLTIVLLLVLALRRARQAWLWRAACHGPGEPDLPAGAELLLHGVLGRRCRSLPGDLSEEYACKIETGCSIAEADRWYRWQVFHSVAPMTARRVESLVAPGFWTNRFRRRG